jgi:predicted oxidoreductase
MRLNAPELVIPAVSEALNQGINFFDHANVYGRGRCEELFAAVWKEFPGLRQKVIFQSKCGIRRIDDPTPGAPGRYDFSYAHIVQSVDASLRRLQTDYLDILLLHRPDPLVEPEEVARAFDELQKSGKVRHFGVSNHTGPQIDLLKRYVRQPLVANQLEVSVLHPTLIDAGVITNQDRPTYPVRGEETLEYCRLHDMMVQAWSPLAGGRFGRDTADERVARVQKVVNELAVAKGVPAEAILVAWLLRHPAGMQVIVGTTRPERIRAASAGDGVELSREEWYRLFVAGRGAEMP